MTTSARETILAAIATKLAGLASGHIYRTRKEQIQALPAIVIQPSHEDATESVLTRQDRNLQVAVNCYAEGDTPDTAVDAILAGAWSALSADLTLGLGSDVQLQPGHTVDWTYDTYDYAQAALNITVNYRTSIGSM